MAADDNKVIFMRDFNKDAGSTTMDIGTGVTAAVLNGAASVSFSAFVVVDSASSTGNYVFSFEINGQLGLNVRALSTGPLRFQARPVSTIRSGTWIRRAA